MTLSIGRRLTLVGEQSAALLAAASATELGAPVPSCPEWTVRDLVSHHGNVLRGWANVIGAGEATAPPAWMTKENGGGGPWETMGQDWQPWYVASHRGFRGAVEAAGEDAPSWAWWQHVAPTTAGTIARHQVQEACVHRWDAQTAAGLTVDPLPDDAAADGVEEFLTICVPAEPWPWDGPDTSVAVRAEGQPGWLLAGSGGTITARPLTGDDVPTATVAGSPSDVVLMFYERIPLTALEITGDREAAHRLLS
jgi:uncharacterized protein (TIGR03083 family)